MKIKLPELTTAEAYKILDFLEDIRAAIWDEHDKELVDLYLDELEPHEWEREIDENSGIPF